MVFILSCKPCLFQQTLVEKQSQGKNNLITLLILPNADIVNLIETLINQF